VANRRIWLTSKASNHIVAPSRADLLGEGRRARFRRDMTQSSHNSIVACRRRTCVDLRSNGPEPSGRQVRRFKRRSARARRERCTSEDTFTGGGRASSDRARVFRIPNSVRLRSQFQTRLRSPGSCASAHRSDPRRVVSKTPLHRHGIRRRGDLSKHVSRTKLPVATCCRSFNAAAPSNTRQEGMSIATSSGEPHDRRSSEVKISDFGAPTAQEPVVQTAAMGSPYYMSPSRIAGKELNFHSDMYLARGVAL